MMAAFNLTRLVNRNLIRISGPDCYPYLQSLFSNDLRYLYEPDRIPKRRHAFVSPNVLGTYMLNAQGRVICDLLIYRTPQTKYECKFTKPGEAREPDELLIECDATVASGLANTLYGYRVRRKVALEIVPQLDVWCLYPKVDTTLVQVDAGKESSEVQAIQNLLTTRVTREHIDNNLTLVHDPRLYLMGIRILTPSKNKFDTLKEQLEAAGLDVSNIDDSNINKYLLHKYRVGLGEGSLDHPEGNCLPLESNADLLGSVSFDKGCYLGQELTARIHYTGVVRKRLMPIELTIDRSQNPPKLPFAPGSDIVDAISGKKLGIIRNVHRKRGLSLIRYDLLTDNMSLIHEATKVPIKTWKPNWWHHEHEND